MTNKEAKEKLYIEWQKFLEDNIDYARISEAYKMAFKALEQEPCEDEYIKVPKKALKYRTAGMVVYNVEWLKNHFDIERAVILGCEYKAQEPKTGHWKRGKYTEDDIRYNDNSYKCSGCGRVVDFKENFCPNCGVCMKDCRTLDEFIEDSKEVRNEE